MNMIIVQSEKNFSLCVIPNLIWNLTEFESKMPAFAGMTDVFSFSDCTFLRILL